MTAHGSAAGRDPKRVELARLRRQVLLDELTGLASRRAFLHRLQDEFARAGHTGAPFALALLDLDGLKDLNDTFGHHAGDSALRRFARALSRAAPRDALVARIGGDEFAVIARHRDGTTSAAALENVRRVAMGVVRRVLPDIPPVLLTAAWGAAEWHDGMSDVEALFARAEAALLSSKQALLAELDDRPGVYQPRGRRSLGKELRRLLAMARQVSSARELRDLCRAAAEEAAALVGARMASVALPRPDGHTGYDERFINGRWEPDGWWTRPGEGLVGTVLTTGRPLISNDLPADPRADQVSVTRLQVRTAMCVPLRGRAGQTLGVLSLSGKRGELGFTEADTELALAFADLVATALESVRSREELQTAHAYLRSLLDGAHDAIVITDPATRRIVDANERAVELYGYPRGELVTMHATDLRLPEERSLPIATVEELRGAGVLRGPRRHLRRDGAEIYVETSARIVTTPLGSMVVNVIRDVTERMHAQEELERRNRELQAQYDVAVLLAGAGDDDHALARVLQIVVETLAVDSAALGEVDDAQGVLTFTEAFNLPESLRGPLQGPAPNHVHYLLAPVLEGTTIVTGDPATPAFADCAAFQIPATRSLAAVPMMAHGQTLGVLIAGSARPNHFDEREVALLRGIAGQTALWLENRRLLAESRQRERDARQLAELGDELNRTRDPRTVVRLLTRRAATLLGEAATTLLLNEPAQQWEFAAFHHADSKRRRQVRRRIRAAPRPQVGGLFDRLAHSAEPVIVTGDVDTLPQELVDRLRVFGIGTALMAPLRMGDRVLGVLVTARPLGYPPLTERHRTLAADIARHASVALANALTRRDLVARNQELRLLNDIAALAQRATDAHRLHDAVVRRIGRAFRSGGAFLQLWDADAGVLRYATGHGLAESTVRHLTENPPHLGERLTGLAAATRAPVISTDLHTDPRRLSDRPLPFRSVMIVPLVAGDDLIGALGVVSTRAGAFTHDEVTLLTAVSGPLATALARFQAHARSERASSYARTLIDNAADALFVVDPATERVRDVNAAAEQLSGYARDELLGMDVWQLRPPAERAQPGSTEIVLREGTFHSSGPRHLRRRDGVDVPVEVSATLVESPTGAVALNLVRDVTERTRQEERLRFQSQVLAGVRDGLIAADFTQRIVYWNDAATEIFGWTAAEMLGQRVDQLAPAAERAGHLRDLERVMTGAIVEDERPRLRKDGSIVWCSLRLSAFFDEAGTPAGVLAVVRDVTARRAAEAAVTAARDEATRRAAEFAAAAELSHAIAGGGKPSEQLERLAAHISEVTGFEIVTVNVYDDEHDDLWVATIYHRLAEPPATLLTQLGQHVSGRGSRDFQATLRSLAPTVLHRAAQRPDAEAPPDHWTRRDRIDTMVKVPLLYDGRPVGSFVLASRQSVRVSARDLSLCKALADQAAVAVHTVIEYGRLREMRRDAIFRLAAACEARDVDTGIHLQQIRGLTESLATELGLPPDTVEELSLASMLHDVGKIRTPDAILLKPGRLTAEEMRIMREHTSHGEQILSGPDIYRVAREVAHGHHERWDGTGYPTGLAGDAIPFAARIVAVADVFDALTARRVYKPAWPVERAIAEILAQGGRHFDPRVIEAFEALWRSERLVVRGQRTG